MLDNKERTLLIFKPDALKRGLVGEIISRLERTGLKLICIEQRRPSPELLEQHYADDPIWIENLGEKTKEFFTGQNLGREADSMFKVRFGTSETFELGKIIRRLLIDFMLEGDVIVSIWEGSLAVSVMRKVVGNTVPVNAAPGTIRGDLSNSSPLQLLLDGRCIENLVHASGTREEADREIALWFKE